MLTYQPFELFQVLINANFQDIDASKGYQYYQAFYYPGGGSPGI